MYTGLRGAALGELPASGTVLRIMLYIKKHYKNISIYFKKRLILPAFYPDILMFIIILLVYKTLGTFHR